MTASAGEEMGAKCRTYEIVPHALTNFTTGISAIAATKCMRWVVAATADGHVRKYDFMDSMNGKQRLPQSQMTGLPSTITKTAVSRGSFEVEENGVEDARVVPVHSLAMHHEALWCITGLQNGAMHLYTLRHDAGHCGHVFQAHHDTVSALALLPDEKGVLSGSWDKCIKHWDLDTGSMVRQYTGHTSQVTSLALQPNDPAGNILQSTSYDGECLIWDRRSQQGVVRRFAAASVNAPPWCLSACWSPDGRFIYCGRRNETVDEWDIIAGRQTERILRMPRNSGPVSAVMAMPNGKQLICASRDNIRMWNLSSDQKQVSPFQVIPGHHNAPVSQMLLDDQCRFMVTSSGVRGFGTEEPGQLMFYDVQCILK